MEFDYEVEKLFLNYKWPGNIRELQNIASYLNVMGFEIVTLNDLPQYILNNGIDF
ncbi:hypothetical protein [Caloramator sp. mosi_1]|uniref:hypothetical protein n=1 Tax=Caloramator sp. mosi_1 TaxID=3023090 RepID=UPI003FCE08AE